MEFGKQFPLQNLLKRKQLRIAELQNQAMIALTGNFTTTLHRGTAIWQCYGGKRFSVDIDLYHERPEDIVDFLDDRFTLEN